MLSNDTAGNYRFIPSSSGVPFCDGVVADTGYEIVRATLDRPLPYRAGFDLIERHLASLGRPRQALCALELRCAGQYESRDAFQAFNADYAALLTSWGKFDDATGVGSTTRTNIAPLYDPPAEQVLFAFAYTIPSAIGRPTFVISGATTRDGEDSPEAVREKAANILDVLGSRLAALDLAWDLATDTFVYAPGSPEAILDETALDKLGATIRNGVRWFPGLAPVVGSRLEIGAQGLLQELRIPDGKL
ncbi:MAG TPA: RidA family protein [Dehalococcoidia bacterium]|nr:RidA family protein [Dehalococcoidia bacterium]